MKRGNFIERSIAGVLEFLRESVFSDEYAAKPGFLQARQASFKAAAILALLLAVLFSRSMPAIIFIYALCLCLALFSSINIAFFLKRTWIFIPLFSLFIAIPALFDAFSPGEPLVSFKVSALTFNITKQGLRSAGIFILRVLTSVSLCVLLSLTTRHYQLLKALRSFGVPQIFVTTLGMCYRYVYLFIGILQDTYLAIKSRVGFISSVKKGQGMVAWNIASLWQRSYAMHNQVYHAMLSRGYSGEPKVLDEPRPGPKDMLCLAAALILFLGVIWRVSFLN